MLGLTYQKTHERWQSECKKHYLTNDKMAVMLLGI